MYYLRNQTVILKLRYNKSRHINYAYSSLHFQPCLIPFENSRDGEIAFLSFFLQYHLHFRSEVLTPFSQRIDDGQ